MNATFESVVRFVNLAASGLVAGSLSFGKSPLLPGWEKEIPDRSTFSGSLSPTRHMPYAEAIGPVAIASSVILAVGTARRRTSGRLLDVLCAAGLAGVVATTTLGTVKLKRKIEEEKPLDYESASSKSLSRVWGRVNATRTALGVAAFLCAAASSATRR